MALEIIRIRLIDLTHRPCGYPLKTLAVSKLSGNPARDHQPTRLVDLAHRPCDCPLKTLAVSKLSGKPARDQQPICSDRSVMSSSDVSSSWHDNLCEGVHPDQLVNIVKGIRDDLTAFAVAVSHISKTRSFLGR